MYTDMRHLAARAKATIAARIPDRLRVAVREVLYYIKEVEDEPDNGLEYDDGIQAEGLIGGRCGSPDRPFQFTYWPSAGNNRDLWYLTLSFAELDDIADGTLTRIKMLCCTSPERRNKFREPSEHCFYCDYSDDGDLA